MPSCVGTLAHPIAHRLFRPSLTAVAERFVATVGDSVSRASTMAMGSSFTSYFVLFSSSSLTFILPVPRARVATETEVVYVPSK